MVFDAESLEHGGRVITFEVWSQGIIADELVGEGGWHKGPPGREAGCEGGQAQPGHGAWRRPGATKDSNPAGPRPAG